MPEQPQPATHVQKREVVIRSNGSTWTVGTKDADVYFELWNGDKTQKFIDGDLSPEKAYGLGKLFIDNAIKQGYRP